jgi:hypothetical protein
MFIEYFGEGHTMRLRRLRGFFKQPSERDDQPNSPGANWRQSNFA